MTEAVARHGLRGADAVEYLRLLGVTVPEGEGQPWGADVAYCQFVDAVSGSVCTLEAGHSEKTHRDCSDPMVVLSWSETPELLVVGAPLDDDE